MFQIAEPVSTVQLGDDPTWWPADWQVGGDAYAYVDWRVTAHGEVPVSPWPGHVRVRLRTPLGVFEGEAVAVEATSALHGGVIAMELKGNGPLRYVLPPELMTSANAAFVEWVKQGLRDR